MLNTKETFYILPKKEWYKYEPACMQDFFKRFEDYQIKECTEAEIKKIIDKYNYEQDIKYFDKLKAQDFYFIRVTKIEIGKYKSGKIEILDLWKK